MKMAGRRVGEQFERRIESLGGLPWVVGRLTARRSLRSIAREIGCGRWWLDRWIYADPARKLAVARARVAAFGRASEATARP